MPATVPTRSPALAWADDLRGGNGADIVHAGAGADILNGGTGADRLFGEAGNDSLTGGADGDTFVFDAAFGRDLITDLTMGAGTGHDVIDFNQALFADYNAVKGAMTQSGKDVLIGAGPDVLMIKNATMAGLVAGNFQYH